MGRETHHGYNKNGWKIWTVNPDGSTVDIYYNLEGANGGENTITTVYNESYAVTEYFDDLGRLIQQTERPVDGTESTLRKYYYTGHRVSEVYDGKNNYAAYDYDPFDRVISLVQRDSEDNILGQYSITFDDYNFTRTVNNAGKINKTYYDKLGRPIQSDVQTDAGLASSYTYYDYMGNVKRIVSPKNEETKYIYNNRGLLTNIIDPINRETSYTYDAVGNVLTVVSAGLKIAENTYDCLNRLLTSTDAMGMVSYYAYDAAGRTIASKDRNGQVSTFEYKENTNYLEKQTTDDLQISYTYDIFGNIKTATNSNGTTEYNYKFNNLLETVKTNGKTLTYEYDDNKNISSVTDYFGAVTSYTHDGLNRLKTVIRGGTAVASYDYYQFGALQKITYPGQGTSEFFYDNALRLTGQTNKLADGTILNTYTYQYDLNGNQTKKTDNGAETSYVYDSLGRLTNVTEPDGTHTEYRFDEQSNISNKKITHPSSYEFQFKKNGLDYSMSNVVTHEINYAYDKNNRLKFEGEYIGGSGELFTGFLEIEKYSEYDNNGNLLSTRTGGQIDESMVEYTYNPLNQLTQFKGADGTVTNYTYTPDGMRRSKTTKGVTTQFYWDRGYISNEETNNILTATNFIGAGGIFGRQTTSNTSYMLKNGHGDVVSLVSGGEETKTYDYTAYGVEKTPDPNDTNPFRYCAEYFDAETGNIYLRARYYDPSVGRFISEDPIRDGFNWYSYCFNNPINFIDPNGLKYVPLRATIEGLGGSVSWDSKTGVVTISLDGGTAYAFNGDGNGNFIQGDLMYSDDVWLFAALSVTFDLGNGWTGRIERDASGGRYDKHVHVYKGNKAYAQNEDGSPHDGSTGSPPKKQKENLKNKKGWDWDAKENDWVNKIEIRSGIDGDGWIISYPNGRTVTILNPWIMGVPMQAPYPDRETLRQYYTGPTLINPRGSGTDGTVPVLPMPNPVPVPVPAPMPVPAFGF